MNKQPMYYMQIDPKWKDKPYATQGEKSTIGSAGCGPTSAAMIISTLLNQNVTPVDTCTWAMQKGYKAKNQGTYYSYFIPQFEHYRLKCERLNINRVLNDPRHPVHERAFKLLKEGHYLIALMGPGNWTSSGHFIVVWWKDDKVYINDSNSTKPLRIRGDIDTFKKQCRMYWAIPIAQGKEEEEEVTQEQFNAMMDTYLAQQKKLAPSNWTAEERKWAEDNKLIQGDTNGDLQYRANVSREQMVVFMKRLNELNK